MQSVRYIHQKDISYRTSIWGAESGITEISENIPTKDLLARAIFVAQTAGISLRIGEKLLGHPRAIIIRRRHMFVA